jgi:Sigma-70 region 2
MARVYQGSIVESLGRLFATGTATAMGEAELLERFVSQGDPTGFEVILQRHGPMVFRVCRRVLDDPNDVDDSFQATFPRTSPGSPLATTCRLRTSQCKQNCRRKSRSSSEPGMQSPTISVAAWLGKSSLPSVMRGRLSRSKSKARNGDASRIDAKTEVGR